MNERALFEAAAAITDPQQRRVLLDQACADKPELRARVEALLRSDEAAGSFLEMPLVDKPKSNVVYGADQTVEYSKSAAEREDEDDPDADAISLNFLEPATKPGSIGRLGHYEILSILGQGAFGIVFKAFDEKLHRQVAIKVMSPELAATSPPRKRFLREARAAAAVRHENVVQVYSVEEQPLPYLVMEYIDGQTLQQKLDGAGPLETAEILQLSRQIACGLAAAHAQGLIHRDIKPGNILLEQGADQKLKITDFGLARTADDATMTRTGTIAGTPMYMAPEQAQGQTLDHRADLFSFGSVLYQMACGRPPFREATTFAVLRRVVEDTPRPLQEIIPEIPDWLVSIVSKLHAKQPSDRFQTAKEVADLLTRCQSELQSMGRVTSVKIASDQATTPSSNREVPANELVKTPNRLEIIKVLALMGLVGLATHGLMSLFGRQISNWLNPAPHPLRLTQGTGGLSFDGKDDFVKVSSLDWSCPQYTVEAYVTSAPDSDNGTVVSLSRQGDVEEWMSLVDGSPERDGKRVSGALMMGQPPAVYAYGPLTTGERQHRALVFDGRKLHYYLNGVWQGERSTSAHEEMMWKMQELKIGCDRDDRRFFQGTIDQLRISKVARYNENFSPQDAITSDASTLALYNFDEGQGEILKDISGNGHDGTISGAAWVKSSSIAASKVEPYRWPADTPAPAIAPFDATQAKQHQQSWADYLKLPVEYTNSIGMKFVLIPPGEFLMGSNQEEVETALPYAGDDALWQETIRSEAPQHRVVLTQPLYIGVHEVTQDQFERVTGKNPSRFSAKGSEAAAVVGTDTTTHPVEDVSWSDATAFCTTLSQLEHLASATEANENSKLMLDSMHYRLPTEAQWEFSCRAGSITQFCTGDNNLDSVGWCNDNAGSQTHPVGTLRENAFGLHDAHGNVWEWVQDTWDASFYQRFAQDAAVDPIQADQDQTSHLTRGGNWASYASSCRSAYRCPDIAAYKNSTIGFRVLLPVAAVKVLLQRQLDEGPTKANLHGPLTPSEVVLSPGYEWSPPVNLGPHVNTEAREAMPSLTDDELLMIFIRTNELHEARRASRDEPFGSAEQLRGPFTGTPQGAVTAASGSISGDGLQLVFTSGLVGEENEDVMIATRNTRDEPFGPAIKLPPPVNSSGVERHPVLSSDGLTLAVTVSRPMERPGSVLLFARIDRDSPFTSLAVEGELNSAWDTVNSFAADGLGLLKTTMAENVESITWHARSDKQSPYEPGQKLQPPFDQLTFGGPFLSADGLTLYFHTRHLPYNAGDLDLWMSRRVKVGDKH